MTVATVNWPSWGNVAQSAARVLPPLGGTPHATVFTGLEGERETGLHTAARQLSLQEWEDLSTLVFNRDGWMCLAPRLDPDAGACHDRQGKPFRQIGPARQVREYLTLQHVTLFGKTEHDAAHLLTLCWGHHLGTGEKGGRIWSKIKNAAAAQRNYLIDRYFAEEKSDPATTTDAAV